MYFLEILLIALGLSMDSFAVSVSNGIRIKSYKFNLALKNALFFAAFQGAMPIIGYTIGLGFKNIITSFDHWIAFGLLALIGVKMIYESVKGDNNKAILNVQNNKILIMQSIATSIDALIVGTSLAFLNFPILTSSLIIGIVTLIFSFFGVVAGKKCGCVLKDKAEIIGGLILITIGIKILLEHLS